MTIRIPAKREFYCIIKACQTLFEISNVLSVNGGNTSVNHSAGQIFAILKRYDSLNCHLAHDVGVLSHERKELAALYMGEGTVRNHVSGILQKLQLKNRTQIAVMYYRIGQ